MMFNLIFDFWLTGIVFIKTGKTILSPLFDTETGVAGLAYCWPHHH